MTDTIDPFELPNSWNCQKKHKGGIPGDLPKKIVTEFAVEFATPMTKIYQNIVNSQELPEMWKIEHQIPMQKVADPKNED